MRNEGEPSAGDRAKDRRPESRKQEDGKRVWEQKYGTEKSLLEQVERELAIQKTRLIMVG